jgi:hypothetical protein
MSKVLHRPNTPSDFETVEHALEELDDAADSIRCFVDEDAREHCAGQICWAIAVLRDFLMEGKSSP